MPYVPLTEAQIQEILDYAPPTSTTKLNRLSFALLKEIFRAMPDSTESAAIITAIQSLKTSVDTAALPTPADQALATNAVEQTNLLRSLVGGFTELRQLQVTANAELAAIRANTPTNTGQSAPADTSVRTVVKPEEFSILPNNAAWTDSVPVSTPKIDAATKPGAWGDQVVWYFNSTGSKELAHAARIGINRTNLGTMPIREWFNIQYLAGGGDVQITVTLKQIMEGSTTSGSPTVTLETTGGSNYVDDPGSYIATGWGVSGAGIPNGATVSSINVGADTFALSANATATASNVLLTFSKSYTITLPGTTNDWQGWRVYSFQPDKAMLPGCGFSIVVNSGDCNIGGLSLSEATEANLPPVVVVNPSEPQAPPTPPTSTATINGVLKKLGVFQNSGGWTADQQLLANLDPSGTFQARHWGMTLGAASNPWDTYGVASARFEASTGADLDWRGYKEKGIVSVETIVGMGIGWRAQTYADQLQACRDAAGNTAMLDMWNRIAGRFVAGGIGDMWLRIGSEWDCCANPAVPFWNGLTTTQVDTLLGEYMLAWKAHVDAWFAAGGTFGVIECSAYLSSEKWAGTGAVTDGIKARMCKLQLDYLTTKLGTAAAAKARYMIGLDIYDDAWGVAANSALNKAGGVSSATWADKDAKFNYRDAPTLQAISDLAGRLGVQYCISEIAGGANPADYSGQGMDNSRWWNNVLTELATHPATGPGSLHHWLMFCVNADGPRHPLNTAFTAQTAALRTLIAANLS